MPYEIIIYRATHIPVGGKLDRPMSYFGQTGVTEADRRGVMPPSARNRALNRRRNQHYRNAVDGGSRFYRAIRDASIQRDERPDKDPLGQSRFGWTIVMAVRQCPNAPNGEHLDIRTCANLAEAWHIEHCETKQHGYNMAWPGGHPTIDPNQVLLFGLGDHYRGCVFERIARPKPPAEPR